LDSTGCKSEMTDCMWVKKESNSEKRVNMLMLMLMLMIVLVVVHLYVHLSWNSDVENTSQC